MRRTDDPIRSAIRRAHARAKRETRSFKPPSPDPAPDPAPDIPLPPPPPDPPPVPPPVPPSPENDEILRAIKTTPAIDTPPGINPTMEAEVKPLSGLDWLLRR